MPFCSLVFPIPPSLGLLIWGEPTYFILARLTHFTRLDRIMPSLLMSRLCLAGWLISYKQALKEMITENTLCCNNETWCNIRVTLTTCREAWAKFLAFGLLAKSLQWQQFCWQLFHSLTLTCIKTISAAQSRASSLGIDQSDIDHSFAEENYC